MIGERIENYEIRALVGRGAMGAVYRAWDTGLLRDVALKVIAGDAQVTAEDRQMFLREARAAASIQHPNVIRIYELGERDGTPYIVMELVEGVDLRGRMAGGPMPVPEVLRLGHQIAEGLRAAHGRGVVHRDLKPENILIDASDTAKIADFGLARVAAEVTATATGVVKGSPRYMAPEQIRAETVSSATDVWAFGVILFEMLTGQSPFPQDNVMAIFHAVLNEEAPSLADARPNTPERLVRLVHDCLDREAAGRPATRDELLPRIAECLGGDPADTAAPAHHRRLPQPLTPFVGRERELAELLQRSREHRCVTLLGPGGTGKTRLAIEAAERLAPEHPHGAWFVELGTIARGELVVPTLAHALGTRDDDPRTTLDTLSRKLRARRLLVVIDNAEQVVDAVAQMLARLLGDCPGLHVLVTSREALDLPAEQRQLLAPLGLPAPGRPVDLATTLACDAVRLFVERARDAEPEFTLTASNAAAVIGICTRLDGIPLALELAASRLRVMSLDEISKRLQDRFQLLTGGSRTSLPHQQTLRATLEWSHDLLTPIERTVLRRLAVFEGGWTLEAAEAVVGGGDVDPLEALDPLTRLAEKSLVVVQNVLAADETGDGPVEKRHRFLETIHAYAREKLDASEDALGARERHARWYLGFAASARAQLAGATQAGWLDRLDREHDNLRAALVWQHDHAPAAALGLVASLAPFWSTRGHLSEGQGWIEQALDTAPEVHDTDRADALLGLGRIARMRSDYPLGERSYEQARSLSETLGDPVRVARALNGLAGMAMTRSQFTRAREMYERTLALNAEQRDTHGMSQVLSNLGNTLLELGEFEVAAKRYEESLELTRALGNVRQTGIALYNLAYVRSALGDGTQAMTLLEQSEQEFRRLDYREGLAMTALLAGRIATAAGRYDLGARRLGEGLAIAQQLGDRSLIAHFLMAIGEKGIACGDLADARAALSGALRISLELGQPSDACDVLYRIVLLEERALSDERAARLLGAADALRGAQGHPLPPVERAADTAMRARLIERLGDERQAALAREGSALDLTAATELALYPRA